MWCAVEGFSRLPEHRWRMQGLAHREGPGRSAEGPSRVPDCHTLAALYKSPLGAPTYPTV
eukprot:4234121-Prymnesium_polylepis.1